MKWKAAKRRGIEDRRAAGPWTPEQDWQLNERLQQARPMTVPNVPRSYRDLAETIATGLLGHRIDPALGEARSGVSAGVRDYRDLTAPTAFDAATSLEQIFRQRRKP